MGFFALFTNEFEEYTVTVKFTAFGCHGKSVVKEEFTPRNTGLYFEIFETNQMFVLTKQSWRYY